MLHGSLRQARPGAYFTEGDITQQEGIPLNAEAQGVYFELSPQATEPRAAWAAGGRSNPEASGTGSVPYSPLAYQEEHTASAFPAIPFEDDSTDSETSSDNESEELPDP